MVGTYGCVCMSTIGELVHVYIKFSRMLCNSEKYWLRQIKNIYLRFLVLSKFHAWTKPI